MADELHTYLRDHYAGSGGGVRLCRRLADTAPPGSDEQAELRAIAQEIELERPQLAEIIRQVGSRPSRLKAAGAKVGETLSRAKLRASDEAGRVLQFEAMIMGVTGKLQLWRSLLVIESRFDSLDRDQIFRLAQQATSQRDRLGKIHAEAAAHLAGG